MMVTFIDDDGSIECKNKLQPLFKSKNIPGVACIITGKIDTDPLYMKTEDLYSLQSDGWEICSHTHSHISIKTEPQSAVKADLIKSKQWLKDHGFNSSILVYPFGEHDHKSRMLVKKYFKAGIASEPTYNAVPIYNYIIKRPEFGNKTLEDYKAIIDYAESINSWIVWKIHSFYDTFDSSQLQSLSYLIDYIKGKNIPIVTASEGFKTYGNLLELGDYSNEEGNTYSYFLITPNYIPKWRF